MTELGPDGFDFWLGHWDCAFDGGHATNTITRVLGGHVVEERFEVDTPRRWSGMSVSVFDPHRPRWHQTWVDEAGAYWHFVGGLVDGHPSFGTAEPVDADELYKRMVFTDITAEGFAWRWESSPDRETWTVNWEIAYTRRT